MTDSATEAMMMDHEGQRLAARDCALARSIASQMVERYFQPERIEDMRDVRRQITDAAEQAAYEAIQKERELHAGDMAALRAFMKARRIEIMLKPPPMVVAEEGLRS